MPDIKISDLTAASAASGAMQMEVNDSGSSKRITVDQLKAYVIPDASITASKIALNTITAALIAAGAISTTTIADGAVTSIKIAASGVTAGTYGGATAIPVVTVNAAGQVTGMATVAVPSGFPSGGIIIWSGAKTAIPSGWVLCDGLNGTPNLQDRFVIGAGSTYAVGATGGATSGSLTISGSTNTVADHSHGLGNGSNGSSGTATSTAGMSSVSVANGCYGSTTLYSAQTTVSTNAGGHSHTFSGSGSVATLPPYYALCYIMKT